MKRLLLAALMAAVAGCNRSPTTPPYGARGSDLQYGRTVRGLLHEPDTAWFYLHANAGDLIAAYAGSPDTTVLLLFGDSLTTAPHEAFLTNRGQQPGTTAAFTYLVPETGAFSFGMTRPELHQGGGESEFSLLVTNIFIGPEHLKPAINPGQIISGESVDSIGDIDVFTFNGTAGKEVVGYIQATAKSTDGVTMSLYANSPDSVLAQATSAGGDTSLEYYTTNALTLPATGTYHIMLKAATGSYVGPYRFELYPVDSAPESISATVSPGDTVQGESIDHVGDIDVFTVKAKAGAHYNLFAQYLGAPNNVAQFTANDAAGHVLAQTTASIGPALTDGLGSGVFAAPASGQFTITVQGAGGALNRGPYRFFLYPINSAPEIAAADFNLGDSITTETMALPGDTDVFTMHVASASLASLCVSLGIPGAEYPNARITNAAGTVVAGVSIVIGEHCTGFSVTPGTYSVALYDTSAVAFRGRYSVESYAFSAAPEHGSPVITIGDTVTESIDAPRDFDTFTLRAHAFTLVGLTVNATSSNLTPQWSLSGYGRGTQYGGPGTTGYISLDSAGTYTFVMSAYPADATGPYRFVVTPWPVAPEHHAATVALGTSIADESLDFPGDVDQFTLTGTPGGYAIVSLQSGNYLPIWALMLSSDSTLLTHANSSGYVQYSERFQIPASGSVTMRVMQIPGTIMGSGSYQINTATVNPAPEHAPAAVAVGDTVSSESIDYVGDLDQFTFSGTAGQQIAVEFTTPQGVFSDPTHLGGTLVLQLLAPDGTVLGQVASNNPNPLPSQSTGTVTLPVTGQYTIAVSGAGNGQNGNGTYVFAIVPAS